MNTHNYDKDNGLQYKIMISQKYRCMISCLRLKRDIMSYRGLLKATGILKEILTGVLFKIGKATGILKATEGFLQGSNIAIQSNSERTNRKDLIIESPLTLASISSTRLKMTIEMSKQFHLSVRYLNIPKASILSNASTANIVVNT